MRFGTRGLEHEYIQLHSSEFNIDENVLEGIDLEGMSATKPTIRLISVIVLNSETCPYSGGRGW